MEEERSFYRGIRNELGRLEPGSLSTRDRVDYDVLQAQLSFLLHYLYDVRLHERAIDTYVAEPFRRVD